MKKKQKSPTAVAPAKETGLMIVISYVVLLLSNALVIHFANLYFPSQYVLGTYSIDRLWSIIHAAVSIAQFGTLAIPFFHLYEQSQNRMLANWEWMAGYAVINTITVWGTARFSDQLGLGISSWMFVVGLAVILTLVQGIAMMAVGQLMKKAD